MILLVVDTQKLLVTEALFGLERFVDHIKTLITKAREQGVEVVYVVHDDGAGEALTKGKEGFEIYEDFKPMNDEKIFMKDVNSSFKNTGLTEYLREKNQQDIIVVGLQTDKCIDATIKCGFEHGFHMIVPAHANATMDNEFMSGEESYRYYNEYMWNGRYAECIPIEEMVRRIDGTLK
ncbi:MAG: cysteine hydrolase family protein [Cellulosilyticaceae bacterium]